MWRNALAAMLNKALGLRPSHRVVVPGRAHFGSPFAAAASVAGDIVSGLAGGLLDIFIPFRRFQFRWSGIR